jgi:hypothetical protein
MTIKPLIFGAIALVVGMTLNSSAIARELDQYEQQVENQLQGAIKTIKGDGYQLSFPRNVGKLTRRSEAFKTLLLYPNREYIFLAVCDQNCNKVNVIVKDMNGKKITSDATDTPISVVNFKPPTEDRYQVAVRMEKCEAQSCNYGMGIFAKR